MNLLLLLSLALPFACLALLSFVAFLGVAAIGGALSVIGMVIPPSVLPAEKMKTHGAARSAMYTRSTTLRSHDSGTSPTPF